MQTLINQSKERDWYRERCFKDAYGISCQISVKDLLESNGSWIQNDLIFKIGEDIYKLIEIFKGNGDNSTDYVNLEYSGITEKFDRHKKAEERMVELIRNKYGNNK